jgi:hypothetical protein
MEPYGGFLCVECLERRLARPLTVNDLKESPVNTPCDLDTPTLRRLKADLYTALAWRDG